MGCRIKMNGSEYEERNGRWKGCMYVETSVIQKMK